MLDELDQKPKTPEHDVVRLVCLDSENRVLLVKEFDDDNWKLPGGKTHNNETIFEAAVREAKEEIDVDISKEMITNYVSAPIPKSENIRHIMAVKFDPSLIKETSEVVEYQYFKVDNIPDGKFFEHISSAIKFVG